MMGRFSDLDIAAQEAAGKCDVVIDDPHELHERLYAAIKDSVEPQDARTVVLRACEYLLARGAADERAVSALMRMLSDD